MRRPAVLAVLALLTALEPRMALEPARLRCEYLANPIGIATAVPRLSWIVTAPGRRRSQSAYQIRVSSRPGGIGDLWDSGRVVSGEAAHIAYAGAPLASRQRAWWTVRAWDDAGAVSEWAPEATFTVGLLEPGDWEAQWIGVGGDPPAGGRDHNGYHSEMPAEADQTKWVQIDLGGTQAIEAVVLHPARPYNWERDAPGFGFPVRYRVEAAADADFTEPVSLADRTEADQPSPGGEAVTLRCDPVSARYVRLTATRLWRRDAEHCALALAELEVLAGGQVVSRGAAVTALDSIEAAGWSADRLTDGDLTGHAGRPAPAEPATMLRRGFESPAGVRRAILYATARGVYQLWLNGRRVGTCELAPEWTDYRKRIQVQAYDVSELLEPGANVLGAVVGDGWFAGRLGLAGPGRYHYGARPSLLAQLELDLTDGTRRTVATDGTWLLSTDGPIRSADILDGETYDARRQRPGWSKPGFDAAGWQPAAEVPPPAAALVMQPNEPLRVVEELTAVAVTEPSPGAYLFDLGQNMVGWPRLRLHGEAGQELTLRHGEVLNEDGTLYVANLRGAPQTDHYICAGGEAVHEPRFTYHGFRYVEVSGLGYRPEPGDLTGRVVCSSSPDAGQFECSNDELNRLWRAIYWTQRANLFSTPTDCPQRDERLGWMGDIQAFCPTAMFNMDLGGFMTKWLADVRDAQGAEGRYPDFAPLLPTAPPGNAPAWGDAGVIVPWHQWTHYADRRLVAEHFESMARFIDHLDLANPDHLWRNEVGNDYSDWLNANNFEDLPKPPEGGAPPKLLFSTAFFAHSTRLLADMAGLLGRDAEAARYRALRQAIEAAFCAEFLQADGTLTGDTQSGYALALAFDLLPAAARPRAIEHLAAAVERYDGHLSTGIQSTIRMMNVLRDSGHTDLAYRVLLQRTCPSWLYMIEHGGTTIWERWDGYVAGRGYQNPGMNSFNHWAFGAVGEWMAGTILGLRADESAPGFAHAFIAPEPGGGLTWARGRYESIRGTFGVDWRIAAGQYVLAVRIPANATATVTMPYDSPIAIDDPAVRADGRAVRLGSGTYELRQAVR